jgi:hypothetical protein
MLNNEHRYFGIRNSLFLVQYFVTSFSNNIQLQWRRTLVRYNFLEPDRLNGDLGGLTGSG